MNALVIYDLEMSLPESQRGRFLMYLMENFCCDKFPFPKEWIYFKPVQ